MTDLSLAQHRSARCGFTSSAISTNYAALVIGRCGSIHSGFGSAIQTCHKEAPRRAPRASGLPKYPPARPRQDAPQRPNARINVRFAPKATEVLRCRKASLCADCVAKVVLRWSSKILRAVGAVFVLKM